MRKNLIDLTFLVMATFAFNSQSYAADNDNIERKDCRENFAYTELWRVDPIVTGNCNDLVNIGGIILESRLDTGRGSDHIRAGELLRSVVSAGNGNNDISVATIAYDSKIVSGSGNDRITIGGDITRLTLDTGDKADDIVINGNVYEGSLRTGSGNDVLEIGGTEFVRGYIDMGRGYDLFILRGPRLAYAIEYTRGHYILNNFNQNRTYVYNVEAVVFSDGAILIDGVVIEPITP